MGITRSNPSSARRARLLKRGAPLAAAGAAALALTACTPGAQQHGAPGQRPAAHSVTVDGNTGPSGSSGSVTVEQGPDGSSVTVDQGSAGSGSLGGSTSVDGSISVDGNSVHVSGGSVSVVHNPDGSLTITRPGQPPITVPAGPHQGLSVTVDPSNGSTGSVSVNAGSDGASVSVTN